MAQGADSDTLVVSYIGYKTFEQRVAHLAANEHIALHEYATVLDEVLVETFKFDPRDIDRSIRPIRGNLYAMEAEVTNLDYNNFLLTLNETQRKRYGFNSGNYEKSVRDFYERYHKVSKSKKNTNDHNDNFNNYPAVNISHESAEEYCKWLTEQYNEASKKKKFKKVIFRLPTLNEWQIAALGDPKFQSWNLRENFVEVIQPKDTNDMYKGTREKIKVDDRVLYPWYTVYFRNRTYNQFGCYLGNYKITTDRNCHSRARAYDGYTMQSRVKNYFPNNIGLYDVTGNVAEMIDEKGIACGGSWNETPENSTIHSTRRFNGPDETVGFRVFMEVIEK